MSTHLIMKIVIDTDFGPCLLIDPVHVFVKRRSMSVVVIITVGDEQISVDHLVQKRLNKVATGSEFQQRDTQS